MSDHPAAQLGLGLIGYEEARRQAELLPFKGVRARALNRVETLHDLLSELPTGDDLTFNHSGLCQTSLPHARPPSNTTVWKRQSGRFTLMIRPGVMSGVASAVSHASPMGSVTSRA